MSTNYNLIHMHVLVIIMVIKIQPAQPLYVTQSCSEIQGPEILSIASKSNPHTYPI